MKVLIISDFEGISGVYHYKQAYTLYPEYWESRHLMAADINAAAHGLRLAGATGIDVLDCHGDTTVNLEASELAGANLLPKGFDMAWSWLQSIKPAYDALVLVGYHARAGALNAYMPHTLNPEWRVWFNNQEIGEAGMITGIAGERGVPVILATGDKALALEMKAINPKIEVVIVKIALDRARADCLPLPIAHRLIEVSALRALQRQQFIAPWTLPPPVQVKQEFLNSKSADLAALLSGSRRLNAVTVAYTAASFTEAVLATRTMERLALPVRSESQEREINALPDVKEIQRKWLQHRMEAWLGSVDEISNQSAGYFS